MSDTATLETALLETLVPQMQAEGFDVYLHPSPKQVPAFLAGYRPDAVAYKADRKVIVEVLTGSSRAGRGAERLHELVSGHPDWELRIIYAPPTTSLETVPVSTKPEIEAHLDRIELALDTIGPNAALLIAWSALEAAGRLLMPSDLGRPQTPGRLLEALASKGYVTPDEADMLRRLGRLRNATAHGRLDTHVPRNDITQLVQITRTLLSPEHRHD